MITGTMRTDLHLLGTDLRLHKGERVILIPADNLPYPRNMGFFARPLNGNWRDGIQRSEKDSIHINSEDVEIETWKGRD